MFHEKLHSQINFPVRHSSHMKYADMESCCGIFFACKSACKPDSPELKVSLKSDSSPSPKVNHIQKAMPTKILEISPAALLHSRLQPHDALSTASHPSESSSKKVMLMCPPVFVMFWTHGIYNACLWGSSDTCRSKPRHVNFS